MAALKHLIPGLEQTRVTAFSRASRSLKGWRALTPRLMRLPIPRALVGCICAWLINQGLSPMAIYVLTCFVTYMRPGECLRLVKKSLVFPQRLGQFRHHGLVVNDQDMGIPGKTGLYDEAMVLDHCEWLITPLTALAALAPNPLSPIFNFPVTELRKQFNLAVSYLRLQHLDPHLYSLRHGGPHTIY